MSVKSLATGLAVLFFTVAAFAQNVPQLLSYQGRVTNAARNFDGTGQFKFALVDAAGATTYWSNDGTGTGGGQPGTAVAITVTKGLYSVLLGDSAISNMMAIPAGVFANADVRLRVWFSDGPHGFELLTPDQRIAAVGYAVTAGSAATVVNGAIGSAQLAPNLTLGGTVTVSGVLALPPTTTSTGFLSLGGGPFLHDFGSQNTFLGASSGNFSLSGYNNTAVGYQTLSSNTGGFLDTATGAGALSANTTGQYNTATGAGALTANMIGYYNTADGFQALVANTSGIDNTATGASALVANITGYYNTAIGFRALAANTTGNYNIALGINAGSAVASGSYNVDIYDPGQASDTNTIRIGTQGIHTATYVSGIFGTTVTQTPVYINSNGQLGVQTSSRRFKDDIEPMGEGSEALLGLQPVRFRYKPEIDAARTPQFGLIAEDVEKVDPDLVVHDAEGKVFTVRYDAVNAMLLNEFLKQHREVQEQQNAIAEQQKQIQSLAARLNELESLVQNSNGSREVGGSSTCPTFGHP